MTVTYMEHRRIYRNPFSFAICGFRYLLFAGVVCLQGPFLSCCGVYASTVFATNVNESLHLYADPKVQVGLRQINAHWVRGFDEHVLTRIGQGKPNADTNARLSAIRHAAESGYKVIYSLKFNMDGHPSRGYITDYSPGSEREQGVFLAVRELLDVMAPYIDILVVGNEPFAETNPSDFARTVQSDWADSGISGYPLVIFYDRISDHILRYIQSDPDTFGHLQVYCGATQSLHNRTQTAINTWIKAFIEMVDRKDGLSGLDVHIHTEDLIGGSPDRHYSQSRRNLEIVRQFTQKPLLVTEFSLVWRYRFFLSESLGADRKGRQFAAQYGHPPAMKVYAYLNLCRDPPRPQQEWLDFLDSRRWWEPDYLKHMHQLFSEFNVRYAAYRFIHNRPWTVTPDSVPWHLNAMLHVLADPFEDGRFAETPAFAEDFRRLNAPVFDSQIVHLPFAGHYSDRVCTRLLSSNGRGGMPELPIYNRQLTIPEIGATDQSFHNRYNLESVQ